MILRLYLPENNLDTWRLAVQIAGNLGSVARGPSADLSVFFDKTVPVSELSKYNLLVIGQPSEMQILQTMNSILPVPFVANSDVPYSTNPQITYRIPKETSMGFLGNITFTMESSKCNIGSVGEFKARC